MKILFYVQSCRGVGHLHRVAALAMSLVKVHAHAHAIVVSGGPNISDLQARLEQYDARITYIQLEVLQAAQSEAWKLVDEKQRPITTKPTTQKQRITTKQRLKAMLAKM